MSIWAHCKKYEAMPFFGFPAIPSMPEHDIFRVVFPEGYKPNGDQMSVLAAQIRELFGEEILAVSTTNLDIKISKEKLAWVLLGCVRSRK